VFDIEVDAGLLGVHPDFDRKIDSSANSVSVNFYHTTDNLPFYGNEDVEQPDGCRSHGSEGESDSATHKILAGVTCYWSINTCSRIYELVSNAEK
jgi:hypothetical protein